MKTVIQQTIHKQGGGHKKKKTKREVWSNSITFELMTDGEWERETETGIILYHYLYLNSF